MPSNWNVATNFGVYWQTCAREARGLRTYTYVVLNGIFHSGIYTWLDAYFASAISWERSASLALLGYRQFRAQAAWPRVAAALLGIEEIGRITGEFARARRPEIRFEKPAAQQFP